MKEKCIIVFKDHAIIRMLERNINRNEIIETIEHGEIIEDYKDDYPYPSCLMFKMVNHRPIHVVVANDIGEKKKIIITVYIPDKTTFKSDFKTRKKTLI
ncbi:MAG: hypothetical protein A3H98_13160 [Bacteroidetes bacterium RIFCSPLOWO2_02_FULL_36_8]|nr:MAG: hypothetical protein A3H98_13160 [Bacteroidetes bacterium RIFCSPLOWO2_02_FULL_36_8]OFY70243.1 MAG: hypothetical protein A3G23_08860 [Bacteroidetes bacterium RIFCSPLOWO2_12_FULL_37_12]